MNNDDRRSRLESARVRAGLTHREKGIAPVPDRAIAMLDTLTPSNKPRADLRALLAAWPGDHVPKHVLTQWLDACAR